MYHWFWRTVHSTINSLNRYRHSLILVHFLYLSAFLKWGHSSKIFSLYTVWRIFSCLYNVKRDSHYLLVVMSFIHFFCTLLNHFHHLLKDDFKAFPSPIIQLLRLIVFWPVLISGFYLFFGFIDKLLLMIFLSLFHSLFLDFLQ